MSQSKQQTSPTRYDWAASGDLSAFLGLTFDNITQLIVFSTILIAVFHYPPEIVLRRMLPGTAFGVLVGDLIYTWLAFRLAQRTKRSCVTAMPLGIDIVSLFGLTFGAPPARLFADALLAPELKNYTVFGLRSDHRGSGLHV